MAYAASSDRALFTPLIAGHIEAMLESYGRVNVTVYDWQHVETYVFPPLDHIDISFTIK